MVDQSILISAVLPASPMPLFSEKEDVTKGNVFQSHPVFIFLPFGIVTAEGPKIFISNSKFCRTNNLIDIALK